MPAGFDVVVDYGGIGQVCRLEVPAAMPHDTAKEWNSDVQRQRMYDFLADLLPASARGKDGGTILSQMGLITLKKTEYENVTVNEVQNGKQESRDNTITITFKNVGCQTP